MKVIRFKIPAQISVYNPETDSVEMQDIFSDVEMPYTEENEEIAKSEAYNGEYSIEDDGQPEPVEDVTWDDLAAALSEGVNSI